METNRLILLFGKTLSDIFSVNGPRQLYLNLYVADVDMIFTYSLTSYSDKII